MTKEDFSLKKDVLQLQKKVADLELTTTELKEALSKFDTAVIDDLKQRVEDIEDLTMVENAAVIELKKMLESTKSEQPQETISPQLEERLKTLEEKVSNITVPNLEEIKSSIIPSLPILPVDTTKLEESINELRSQFTTLQTDLNNKISSFEERVSQMKNTLTYLPDLNTLKTDLKNEVLSSIPDYGSIRSDVQTMTETFKAELSFEKERIERIESVIQMIKNRLEVPLPERAVEELEKIRNDWMVNIAKIEAVEKFVENFSNEINQLKPVIKKLETFEKLMDLQTEVTEKLEAFKEYRNHIEDAIAKNEEVEKRIQREVSKMKNTEKMFSQIDKSLSVLSKEMERTKREIDEVIRPLEDRIEAVTKNIKDFQDISIRLDKKIESLENTIETIENDMSVFQGNLMSLEQNRSDITAAISDLQETRGHIDKKVDFLQDALNKLSSELAEALKKQPKSEVSELVKKVESLKTEIEGIKLLKSEDKTNELVRKINELESKIDTIQASTVFDEQLNEIISRLVFLESRITAVEGILQDIPRYSPIVVE